MLGVFVVFADVCCNNFAVYAANCVDVGGMKNGLWSSLVLDCGPFCFVLLLVACLVWFCLRLLAVFKNKVNMRSMTSVIVS